MGGSVGRLEPVSTGHPARGSCYGPVHGSPARRAAPFRSLRVAAWPSRPVGTRCPAPAPAHELDLLDDRPPSLARAPHLGRAGTGPDRRAAARQGRHWPAGLDATAVHDVGGLEAHGRPGRPVPRWPDDRRPGAPAALRPSGAAVPGGHSAAAHHVPLLEYTSARRRRSARCSATNDWPSSSGTSTALRRTDARSTEPAFRRPSCGARRAAGAGVASAAGLLPDRPEHRPGWCSAHRTSVAPPRVVRRRV